MVAISGKIQINTWEDQQKVKHTSVDVIVDEQHFAESKSSYESREQYQQPAPQPSSQYQQPAPAPNPAPQPSPQHTYSQPTGNYSGYGGSFQGGLNYTQEEDEDLPF